MLWGWGWPVGNFRRQTYFPHPHPRLHKPQFLNWIPKLMCPIRKSKIFLTSPPLLDVYGGGVLQYQMDTGVRLTLPKAGAFGGKTVSKNDRSLGEKPNFGSKLRNIGWECYFWSFSEHFKSRNLQKKIIANGKNDQFVNEIQTKSSFLWQLNAKNRGSCLIVLWKQGDGF